MRLVEFSTTCLKKCKSSIPGCVDFRARTVAGVFDRVAEGALLIDRTVDVLADLELREVVAFFVALGFRSVAAFGLRDVVAFLVVRRVFGSFVSSALLIVTTDNR